MVELLPNSTLRSPSLPTRPTLVTLFISSDTHPPLLVPHELTSARTRLLPTSWRNMASNADDAYPNVAPMHVILQDALDDVRQCLDGADGSMLTGCSCPLPELQLQQKEMPWWPSNTSLQRLLIHGRRDFLHTSMRCRTLFSATVRLRCCGMLHKSHSCFHQSHPGSSRGPWMHPQYSMLV